MQSFLRRRGGPQIIALLIVSLLVPLAHPAAASAQDADGADSGAPVTGAAAAGAGVARLSVIQGDVGIQRGDAGQSVAAAINAPILGADYVTTGAQSRAEVQFDATAVVRLAENVQMRFARIDDDNRQIQLAAGTIDVRLLKGTDGTTSIDTPSISVVPRTSGSFRITVDEQGTTFVTVRAGQADIETPQGAQSLGSGATLVAQGPASNPQIGSIATLALDNFDDFNQQRDQDEIAALSAPSYANPSIDGVGELGQYGQWVTDGTYGHVWIPANVAAGWAPYRNGNWVWEDGYGWTWVGAEPWGWAPYHYGRWYYSTAYNAWAWYPPARGVAVAAWSPALVGFVGVSLGAGISLGVGFGNVAWVPLAPYETFHPWWGPHAAAISIVNVTNVNVTTVYRNARFNGATGVSVAAFQAGRFAGATVITREQLGTARSVAFRGAVPLVPTTANLRFSARAAYAPPLRTAAFSGRAFAGSATIAPRTPFEVQQQTVSRVTQASSAGYGYRAGAYAAPATHAAYAAPGGGFTGASDPWSRWNANHGSATAGASAYGRGATTTAPAYRSTPAYQSAPAYRSSPAYQSAPAYRSTPAYQSAPAYRSSPAYQSAPAYRSTPAYQSAPAYRSTPAYQRPAYSAPAGGGYRGSYSAPSYRTVPLSTYSRPAAAAPRGGGTARGGASETRR